MITPDLINILTSVIALAAFLLSLYNFYVDRQDKTPNLIIYLSHGNMKKSKEKTTQQAFFIEAINASHINVFITDVYVLLGKQKIRLNAESIEEESFKTVVSPKENVVYWVSMPTKDFAEKELLVDKIKARAFARDSLGKVYKSKWLTFNQSDFLN